MTRHRYVSPTGRRGAFWRPPDDARGEAIRDATGLPTRDALQAMTQWSTLETDGWTIEPETARKRQETGR